MHGFSIFSWVIQAFDTRSDAFRGMVSTRMEGRVDFVETEMGVMKGTMDVMQKDITELKACFLEIKESLGRMEKGAGKDREDCQSEGSGSHGDGNREREDETHGDGN
ncbi:uncharacterized protein G2W53_001214 [Senna tora]|uniref:Uncharacterized protein n=1 Tax=Senna tora TaxID=362788 RepID=A0A834XH83_9FABA|nr:uncharacterized protein G2W53_001214 [Senna tora]